MATTTTTRLPRINLTISKEKVEEQKKLREPVGPGFYIVECQGFDYKKSNDGESTNMRPKLVIIDRFDPPEGTLPLDPSIKGKKRLFENLNSDCWYQHDFAHCFGLQMDVDEKGNFRLPGDIIGKNNAPPDVNNPQTWLYVGPLVGKQGVVKVVTRMYNNAPQDAIDRYVCDIARCEEKHSAHLQKQ